MSDLLKEPIKEKQKDRELIISLFDLKQLLSKKRFFIRFSAFFIAFLMLFYTLLQPTVYESFGVFKEKEKQRPRIQGGFFDLVNPSLGQKSQQESISLMQSSEVLNPLIDHFCLQGKIEEKTYQSSYLKQIWHNLKISKAHLRKQKIPIFEEKVPLVKFKNLSYDLEIPLFYTISFTSENSFTVFNQKNNEIGTGFLDKPFKTEEISFTLEKKKNHSLKKRVFKLDFYPKMMALKQLKANLSIEADLQDSTLIMISYKGPKRVFGALLVNYLMKSYENYLQKEHIRISTTQIDYLKKRQKESLSDLKQLLNSQALSNSKELYQKGFASSDQEMQFLKKAQVKHQEYLLNLSQEIKKLNNLQSSQENSYYTPSKIFTDSIFINQSLQKIRELKNKRATLTLALNKKLEEKAPENQLKKLSEIEEMAKELQSLIHLLETDNQKHLNDLNTPLLTKENHLIQIWKERVIQSEQEWNRAQDPEKTEKQERIDQQKVGFVRYLKNLQELFAINQKVLEEKIAQQHDSTSAFEGADLKTTNQLYLNYTKELDLLDQNHHHYSFLLKEIENPLFDISALNTILTDQISLKAIQTSHEIQQKLNDQKHHTEREKSRLTELLNQQKNFLKEHIKQNQELVLLKQKVIKNKIKSIQTLSIQLLNQEISVKEKQLDRYVLGRIDELTKEQKVKEQELLDLQEKMAKLPEHWVGEKLVAQHLSSRQELLAEVSRLVESKNISHNLELIQSTTLEKAQAPILPNNPHIFLFTFLGLVFGAVLSSGFLVVQACFQPLFASYHNSRALGFFVEKLKIDTVDQNSNPSILEEKTLFSLRRLIEHKAHLQTKKVVILSKKRENLAKELSFLYHKQGLSCLIIDGFFDSTPEKGALLEAIENQTVPKVKKHPYFDLIESGGFCRYQKELIKSRPFEKIIDHFSMHYDKIFIQICCDQKEISSYTTLAFSDINFLIIEEEMVELEELCNIDRVKNTLVFKEKA